MWAFALCVCVVSWFVYYWFNLCKKPVLYFQKNPRNEFLLQHCPSLLKKFLPTFWCANTHAQTIFNVALRHDLKLDFKREDYITPEGDVMILHWVTEIKPLDATAPTIIVFPGVNGGSQELEIRHFVHLMRLNHFRCVVVNYRGTYTNLASSRFGVRSADLEHMIPHIAKKHPQSPVIGVGFSLGSNILMKYLGEVQTNTPLIAGISVSNPFDLDRASHNLLRPFGKLVYDRFFMMRRKQLVTSNYDKFSACHGFDKDRLTKCRNTREFDDLVTRVVWNRKSLDELYHGESCKKAVRNISIPAFFLNALDDPISCYTSIPYDDIRANPNVILATTPCGGHVAWLEGLFPIGTSWMERICLQYINATLRHHALQQQQKQQPQQQQQLEIGLAHPQESYS